jgi:hypothetical protein
MPPTHNPKDTNLSNISWTNGFVNGIFIGFISGITLTVIMSKR